jgi:hypothetical protein
MKIDLARKRTTVVGAVEVVTALEDAGSRALN